MTKLKDLIKPESRNLKYLGCSDFTYRGCCQFCHSDLVDEMPEFEIEGYTMQVCCAVQHWIGATLRHKNAFLETHPVDKGKGVPLKTFPGE